MKSHELIINNKVKILPLLISWVETFNPENILYNKNRIDEDDEEQMLKSYEYLSEIVAKLKSNQCSAQDFEEILFQINQINYEETRIEL